MRPHLTVGWGRGRAIGILIFLAGVLAPVPVASAAPAAVDQYTEQPGTGPAGNSQQLQTQAPNAGGGGGNSTSQSAAQPSVPDAEAAQGSGPATPTYSPPQSASQGSLVGATSQDAKAPKSHEAARPGGIAKHHDAGLRADRQPASASNDDGSTVPLLGYPLTTFVAVLLVLALTGLAAGAVALTHGRLWGASRSS
jgi:hypothetical protein